MVGNVIEGVETSCEVGKPNGGGLEDDDIGDEASAGVLRLEDCLATGTINRISRGPTGSAEVQESNRRSGAVGACSGQQGGGSRRRTGSILSHGGLALGRPGVCVESGEVQQSVQSGRAVHQIIDRLPSQMFSGFRSGSGLPGPEST